MMEGKLTLGKTLKEYRKRSGLTQAELAKEIDLSRSYLSDVENDRQNPSVLTVENILESLGVKVSFAEYLEKTLREVDFYDN